jgi:hypothetical protein
MAVTMSPEGEWPTLDEWPSVQADVTCRTPGCPVENQPFRATLFENADGIFRAYCGRCHTPNDDIVIVKG